MTPPDTSRGCMPPQPSLAALEREMRAADIGAHPSDLHRWADEIATIRSAQGWQPIATAPKDGSAILAYGIHSHAPADAQKGVKAGDTWWAILVWDVWRGDPAEGWGESSRWVFSKDGKPAWSFPSGWRPLPEAPRPTEDPR